MQDTPHKKLLDLSYILSCHKEASEVLFNPLFSLWSGSSQPHKHHYGKGKLIEHTCEVVEIAKSLNGYFFGINKGVSSQHLYLACLFHDVGKLWDYTHSEDYLHWSEAPHRSLINHVSRSAMEWERVADKFGWSSESKQEVTHCILSHHGLKDWGSPVQPQTRMAWLLHLSDGLSARMDDCDKRKSMSTEPKK